MEALNELIERLKAVPQWQRWLIIVVLGALIFWLLYNFNIQPLKEELVQKRQEAERLALTVSRLKVVEKRKKALEEEIETLRKKIAELEEKLPTGREDVAQILRALATENQNIRVQYLKREQEEKHKYYEAYPYTVILEGAYPDFLWWCEKLSKAERIINFANTEVTALQSQDGLQNAPVRVKMVIKAFTLTK